MKNFLICAAVALLLLSACARNRQKLSPQGNLNLKSANVYYTQKDNEASLRKALGYYEKVLADNPEHVLALKRSADLVYYFATQIEPKKLEKGELVEFQNLDKATEVLAAFRTTYGRYDSVLVVMNRFEKLDDKERATRRDASKKKESSWVKSLKIAQILAENKSYEEAIRNYEYLSKLEPARPEPYRLLVSAYQEIKDQDKLEFYLDKVLSTNPDDVEMLSLMGAHYYNDNDYAKAITYFERIAAIRPLDINNLLLLSASHTELKEYQPALDALVKILKIEPENLDALTSAKDLSRALGNQDAEIDYMKRIINKRPNAENLKAYCYMMLGYKQLEGLMDYAEQWFNLDRTNKEAVQMCYTIAQQVGRKDLQQKYTDIYKAMP